MVVVVLVLMLLVVVWLWLSCGWVADKISRRSVRKTRRLCTSRTAGLQQAARCNQEPGGAERDENGYFRCPEMNADEILMVGVL
jgi:hypothetical protein